MHFNLNIHFEKSRIKLHINEEMKQCVKTWESDIDGGKMGFPP